MKTKLYLSGSSSPPSTFTFFFLLTLICLAAPILSPPPGSLFRTRLTEASPAHCLKSVDGEDGPVCQACQQGFYLDSNQDCQSCDQNCKACKYEPTHCIACKDNFILKGQKCENCPRGCQKCANERSCLVCQKGFFLKSDGSCSACDPKCASCSTEIYCSACKKGFKLEKHPSYQVCVSSSNGVYYGLMGSLSAFLIFLALLVCCKVNQERLKAQSEDIIAGLVPQDKMEDVDASVSVDMSQTQSESKTELSEVSGTNKTEVKESPKNKPGEASKDNVESVNVSQEEESTKDKYDTYKEEEDPEDEEPTL